MREGLTAEVKHLFPRFFYDELGAILFDAVCVLPEYYVTRAEDQILADHAEIIVEEVGAVDRIVELGSGSSQKTHRLLDAVFKRQDRLTYVPIDITAEALEHSAHKLLGKYPGLEVEAYAGEYSDALDVLEAKPAGAAKKTLALFLGSSIGNLDPDAAITLLRQAHCCLGDGDKLLLGADLDKDESVLIPAYDDELGVTAAFNRNILRRINCELDADFDVRSFDHRAVYRSDRGRVEMHLVSTRAQTVTIRALDLAATFQAGESIHTENSRKYQLDQLDELARKSGFKRQRTWYDAGNRFSSNLLEVEAG